jgi:hypothetical protein
MNPDLAHPIEKSICSLARQYASQRDLKPNEVADLIISFGEQNNATASQIAGGLLEARDHGSYTAWSDQMITTLAERHGRPGMTEAGAAAAAAYKSQRALKRRLMRELSAAGVVNWSPLHGRIPSGPAPRDEWQNDRLPMPKPSQSADTASHVVEFPTQEPTTAPVTQ